MPRLAWASTPLFSSMTQDVDGRDKPGHDGVEVSVIRSGRGARRDSAAAIASAQASGVRKPGTPACASIASACGASGTRKAASGFPAPALSMIGCTVVFGMRARRRADGGEHEIEFRRCQHDVERCLHGVVARARDREIDQTRGLHRDAGRRLDSPQRLGARRLDRKTAQAQRIDHHGGAAGRGGHNPDRLAGRRAGSDRHARDQRHAFDQAVERQHARDAAFGEKHVGDVVLAGKRAGMRDREFARCGRTSELVGENGLAACRRAEREAPQPVGMPHGFEKQHVAVDAGIVERRGADLAEREIDLVTD